MSSTQEANVVVAAGADAVGLVGPMPSGPGQIGDSVIAEIAATVPPPTATFLLTSETSVEGIVAHVRRTRTNTLQLVARVAPKDHCEIRRRLPGVELVQVLHVEDDDQALESARVVAGTVDALLLDSGSTSSPVPELGGTGRVHDWDQSRRIVDVSPVPVFLAGGLHASNIVEAVTTVRPFGVDVCTGVRTDGKLDLDKLQAFCTALSLAQR